MSLKEDMLVEVVNNGTGSVSYFSELSRMKRRWDKPNSKKKIKLEELRELVSSSGGYELLTSSLLIKNPDVRIELGLPVDEEYLLDDKQIKELLKKAASTIRETLENAPESIREKTATIAIETELSNLDKIEAINELSGIDVLTAIQEKREEEKEKKESKTKSKSPATKRGRPKTKKD